MSKISEENNAKSNKELIMEIHRNTALTSDEKNAKIREIMLGKFQNSEKIIMDACTHYKKQCTNFHFTCCEKIYDCCRCHNQANMCNGKINIDTIECKKCGTSQSPSYSCVKCFVKFSRSHCSICNIWSEKNIFHCEKCGICRVGEQSNYFHCDNCQGCFKIAKDDEHPHECCSNLSPSIQCLLCLENAYTSQYKLICLSKCKHPVHGECMRMALQNGNYKCPLCRKCMIDMTTYWTVVDNEILSHPLPEELMKKVSILCYDCGNKTENADWHFIGVKCNTCNSYNTSNI